MHSFGINWLDNKQIQIFSGFIIITASGLMPIWQPITALNEHDNQRIIQALVIFISALTLLYHTTKKTFKISRNSVFIILITIAIGLISTLAANQPLWAIAEWSILIGSIGMAATINNIRRKNPESIDAIIYGGVALVCLALSAKAMIAYISAISADLNWPIDTRAMLDGFSNLRFWGQFSTLTLPLLALPCLSPSERYKRYRTLSVILLTLWWMLAIASGTRGTWMAMGAVSMLMLFFGQAARRWSLIQISAALTSIALYYLYFILIPEYLGKSIIGSAADRLTTSLSAREVIWLHAIEIIKDHPILGAGPMHFADHPNPIAAHPHQILLQWASEWGIPSTLLVTFFILILGSRVLKTIHLNSSTPSHENALRICLAAAITGCLTQGMVDGVLVMPTTQVWLAILCGWLWSITNSSHPTITLRKSAVAFSLIACMASVILIHKTWTDLPDLHDPQSSLRQSNWSSHLQPRFWTQGIIGDRR